MNRVIANTAEAKVLAKRKRQDKGKNEKENKKNKNNSDDDNNNRIDCEDVGNNKNNDENDNENDKNNEEQGENNENNNTNTQNQRLKSYTKRPETWREVTDYYVQRGITLTKAAFPNELAGRSHKNIKQLMRTWKKEYNIDDRVRNHRMADYGHDIDYELKTRMLSNIQFGLAVDNETVRLVCVFISGYICMYIRM